ncbi:MAG: hypothetical protein CO002_00990 [Candidatus Portnoybacteria bacterium CG_4_8_14_3_um_filter_44_10]|uniref:Uncharacterized protein n=1 Tax=Candidatus Portnoybacteria bacterium CG_4_8_14_3_um_filter_44_10 TaxID=1974802 RepID=A0A2M7IGJ2_9BACT|nr:MAG: hypothetical protein CO002_00990 [Candidatus Portnoybacteria bacterium CG_4_8_14_3_um_filter_44_10]
MEEFKLSVPKPNKTGLELLYELFELMTEDEKTAYVVVGYQRGIYPKIDFWRIASNGIAAGFLSVPLLKPFGLEEILLDKKIPDNLIVSPQKEEFITAREEYPEAWVNHYLDAKWLVGSFAKVIDSSQQIERGEAFVLRWSLKPDKETRIKLSFDECRLAPRDVLLRYIQEVDRRLTYNLTLFSSHKECDEAPKYLFATPLTELVYPITHGWYARGLRETNKPFVLDKVREYKTIPLVLGLEPASPLFKLAEEFDGLFWQRKADFLRLFTYWRELDKELDRLNQEYVRERTGRYCH